MQKQAASRYHSPLLCERLEPKEASGMVSAHRSLFVPTCNSRRAPPPHGSSFPMASRPMLTCEDVGEGIATGDLQGWMLGPKDIEEERGETTQDAQETEGSNDPQQQYRLGIHAEICRARTKSSRAPHPPKVLLLGRACVSHPPPPPPQSWGISGVWRGACVSAPATAPSQPAEERNCRRAPLCLKSFFPFQQNHSKCRAPLPCTCHTLLTICKDPDN